MKKQELPKWFKGEIYDKGDIVRNRFSGEQYELNNIELTMYDLFCRLFFFKKFSISPFFLLNKLTIAQ